jgi:hypothetical protein
MSVGGRSEAAPANADFTVRMDTAGEFKELNNSGSSSFLKG